MASGVALDDVSTGDAAATLATSSGDITIDSPANIILDADSTDILLKDGGTTYGQFFKDSNDFKIVSSIQDGDIVFRGNDGGSGINALTLDMSDGGKAIFNSGVAIGGTGAANTLDDYEEGTFTPTGDGITFTTASGSYTKIGRTVHVTVVVEFPSSGNSNSASINNFPFTCQNGDQFRGGFAVGFTNFGIIVLGVLMSANTTGAVIHDHDGNAISNNTIAGRSNRKIIFGGSYPTAS